MLQSARRASRRPDPRDLVHVQHLITRWNSQSLATQFLLIGGAVAACAMVLVGAFVSNRIEDAVTRNSAATTALYVDSVIAPLLPDMQTNEVLDETVARALDGVVAGTELLRPGLVVLSAPGALRYYGGVDELDVNEQNPDAVDFYRRRGFEQVGRSPVDSDGRPFPLLHFRRAGVP